MQNLGSSLEILLKVNQKSLYLCEKFILALLLSRLPTLYFLKISDLFERAQWDWYSVCSLGSKMKCMNIKNVKWYAVKPSVGMDQWYKMGYSTNIHMISIISSTAANSHMCPGSI